MKRRLFLSRVGALIAVAAAPALPVLAHDSRVTYGMEILREELIPLNELPCPTDFADQVRAVARCQGVYAYAWCLVEMGGWDRLDIREIVRADIRHQLRLHFREQGLQP